MPRKSFFINETELDEFQRVIINRRADNSLIVRGCAGSGKSIIALWKAKEIQNRGHSYLYIVYTKALRRYISDGITQIKLDEKNVDTFGKCFFWNRTADGRWEKGAWNKGFYDYIIVDEAQDFSLEALIELKSHSNKILLYGDSAQTLYSEFSFDNKPTVDMEKIKSNFRIPLESLVINHRLPKKIGRIAEFLNDEGDDIEGRCKNEGSEIPRIIKYKSFEEQLDAIQKIVTNKRFEDVGILFSKRAEIQRADAYFKDKGFNVESNSGDDDLNFNSNNPKLMPYHSSKGLQFEVVFLPECSCSMLRDKNPLYVAITRTYSSLYVMYSGILSPFFDSVPPENYKTTEFDTIDEI